MAMPDLVTLLVPVGENRPRAIEARPLPARLDGLHVGFLDNTKANFDILARGLADVLRERHRVAAVTIRRKPNASTPAPPEVIAALAKECQVVFAGSGD
jgi:hypothetical protein